MAKFSYWSIARVVLLGLATGGAAGVVTSIATTQSLRTYEAQLMSGNQVPTVSAEKPSPVPGTYEEALRRVRQSGDASLALFMPRSEDSSTAADWNSDADVVGLGVVVSNDGWILTTKDVLSACGDLALCDVWIAGTRYAMGETTEDVLTNFGLARVSASGLNAIGFGAAADILSGEMVFALSAQEGVTATSVSNNDAAVLAGSQPAEQFATAWGLADVFESGVPLVNASGEIVGFTTGDATALPLHHGLGFVQRTLRSGSASYAGLGAYVVDLSRTYGVSSDLRQSVDAGALVLSSTAGTRALLRGAAGAESGLAEHDIILSIDGDAITSDVTLAEILATYEPEQTAHLSVRRGGETVTVEVTFGDYEQLGY